MAIRYPLVLNGTTIEELQAADSIDFTSASISGDLTFTGTGARIKANFSDTTATNRLLFQTTTANSTTLVGIMPSGTGTTSGIYGVNSSTLTNASYFDLRVSGSGSDVRLTSDYYGAGTYLPITFYTGGLEQVRITANSGAAANFQFSQSAMRITGDFSNGTAANRVLFQTSTTNSTTAVGIMPSGTGSTSIIYGANNSDLTNASYFDLRVSGSGNDVRLSSDYYGAGTYLPITFYTGGSERVRINTSGSVGIGATAGGDTSIVSAKNITGATTAFGFRQLGSVQSDVTSQANGVQSGVGTAATAFTLASLRQFFASQGTIGAGSAVTNQFGFSVDSGLTGATNNYGFYGNIASGTGRYNFYAAGSASNYFGGDTVISVNSSTDALRITQTGAGNALVVEDSANPDSSPFVIDASGRMLVGSSTSTSALGYEAGAQFYQTTGTISQFRYTSDANATESLGVKSRGTQAAPTIVSSGDNIWFGRYLGYDGTNYIEAVRIAAVVDATPGTNDMPGRLVFSTTADGASSPTERMRIDSTGAVGVGGTGGAAYTMRFSKNLTGSTTVYNVSNEGTIQSDVTGTANLFYTAGKTTAASFTLSSLRHFTADQGTFGAGSTVTSQFGFSANASLTGATNNYGFYSNIASGTGRWNFYANGTADNYFAGAVGVGAVPSAGVNLTIGGSATGSISTRAVGVFTTVQSDSTTSYQSFRSSPSTAAAAVVFSELSHYVANQAVIGSGSSVTSQYGFRAESTLTGATNNYGFYSNIASGTGRYNFYAAGTADNYFAGSVGVGGLPAAGNSLVSYKPMSGGSGYAYAFNNVAQVNSDTTTEAASFQSYLSTQAASFTVANIRHFKAFQSTIGAGSTVTTQVGFFVDPSLTGATNNYGVYSNIASGSNRYNFYAAGTADNYFAGSIGIAGAPSAGINVINYKPLTGATAAYAFAVNASAQSDVTGTAVGYNTYIGTAAAAFTLGAIKHFNATQATIGSGSTLTNQYGYFSDNTLIGATNNYGFYSNIASGTGRYNFYAAGTADNYFAGAIKGNTTLAGGYTAHATGTTAMVLGSNKVVKVTPNATATFTTTVAPAGATAKIIIVTSGTTSYTITFGTGFLSTGTLATGTVTAKTFVVSFVSDGTTMIESSRTTAM